MSKPQLMTLHGNKRWRVLWTDPEGKRRANFFEAREAADSFALAHGAGESMAKLVALTEGQRERLLASLHLAGGVEHVEEAVKAWIASRPRQDVLFSAALDECVGVKERAGKSRAYTSNLRTGLTHLDRYYPNRTVASFTAQEIDQWLNNSGWAPETRRTFLFRAWAFFAWATKRGYCARNIVEDVERPVKQPHRPVILTVEQAQSLLRACLKVDSALVTYFALALFAGVRPAEIRRLTREQVLRNGHVEVDAAQAKTRRRRLVEIQPNLAEWLKLPGELPVVNWRRRFRAVVAASGVAWTNDMMRHSFCSYSLPLKGGAWTALQAGNTESVLFRDYRELVTREQAEAYFAITPATLAAEPA